VARAAMSYKRVLVAGVAALLLLASQALGKP
jgi:hypothetical protein